MHTKSLKCHKTNHEVLPFKIKYRSIRKKKTINFQLSPLQSEYANLFSLHRTKTSALCMSIAIRHHDFSKPFVFPISKNNAESSALFQNENYREINVRPIKSRPWQLIKRKCSCCWVKRICNIFIRPDCLFLERKDALAYCVDSTNTTCSHLLLFMPMNFLWNLQ